MHMSRSNVRANVSPTVQAASQPLKAAPHVDGVARFRSMVDADRSQLHCARIDFATPIIHRSAHRLNPPQVCGSGLLPSTTNGGLGPSRGRATRSRGRRQAHSKKQAARSRGHWPGRQPTDPVH